MSTANDFPIVLIKRKNIQTIFDYCMDNKIEFRVREKPFTVEEFEVILHIDDIKQAIGFGIFARESKVEVVGVNDKQQQAQAKTTRKPATKAPEAEPVKNEIIMEDEDDTEEEAENAPEMEKQEDKGGLSLDLSTPTLSFS